MQRRFKLLINGIKSDPKLGVEIPLQHNFGLYTEYHAQSYDDN